MRKSAEQIGKQIQTKTYSGLVDVDEVAGMFADDAILGVCYLMNKQHATIASLEARIRDLERTIRHNKKG